MKKPTLYLIGALFLSFFGSSAFALEAMDKALVKNLPPDSVVTITGIIYNAKDNTPIIARIKYKKLPHGDDVGIFTSRSNGIYEMPVINQQNYLFEAEANGFYPLKQQVQINDFNHDRLVEKNFYMEPLRVGQIMDFDDILFEQSEAILLLDSYPVLDKLVDILTTNNSLVIQLEGHTDFRGPAKANRKLSDRRVKMIRNYLINKGIHRKRVKTKAFGGAKPISTEDTPEASKLNRRVEIRILEE